MHNMAELCSDPIHVYSVDDAVRDGVLVFAGDIARELFALPVALTRAVWDNCVKWDESDALHTGAIGQDETGRLWDVLWMTRWAIQRDGGPSCTSTFEVQLLRIPRTHESVEGTEPAAEPVTLRAGTGFRDDRTPVLLISFPEED